VLRLAALDDVVQVSQNLFVAEVSRKVPHPFVKNVDQLTLAQSLRVVERRQAVFTALVALGIDIVQH